MFKTITVACCVIVTLASASQTIAQITDALPPSSTNATATTQLPVPPIEVDPESMDLCIRGSDMAFIVNHTWTEESCDQSCRCVFRSEPRNPIVDIQIIPTTNMRNGSEQTEIRCGMPAKCEPIINKFRPTAECPSPKLIFPQVDLEECSCPRVSCGLRTTTASPPAGCRPKQAGGRLLSFGETFNEDCRLTCRCAEDSEIRCQPFICRRDPSEFTDNGTCLEWQPDPSFEASPLENKCCPPMVCRQRLLPSTTSERPQTTTQASVSSSSTIASTLASAGGSMASVSPSVPVVSHPRVSATMVHPSDSMEVSSQHRGFDCDFSWQKRYAMHLLIGFCTMSVLFILVSCMYLKKSPRFVAPITSQSAHDNPTFTKLKSYATQSFLVDQNYTNEVIMAKKKNLELNNNSINIHQINDIHHQEGRQHLI